MTHRRLRLLSGIVMFAYIAIHLLNHEARHHFARHRGNWPALCNGVLADPNNDTSSVWGSGDSFFARTLGPLQSYFLEVAVGRGYPARLWL